MSQVTNHTPEQVAAIETQIKELRWQKSQLAKSRNEQIANAQEMIRLVNSEFDEMAVELSRQISALEELLPEDDEPTTPRPRARTAKNKERAEISVEDGFTPAEVEMYNRLKSKKG